MPTQTATTETPPADPPAAAPSPAPTPTDTASAPTPTAAPTPTPDPAPVKDWKDERIRQLTARLAKQDKAPTPTAAPTPSATGVQDDFNARVSAAASAQVAQLEFDRKCSNVAAEGKREFGAEFDVAVANLQRLVDADDPKSVAQYMLFVETAIDTGKGAKLLFDLGKDLNKAMGVLAQTPSRMAVELTKMSIADGAVAEPSKAPKPITPVGDSGRSHEPIEPTDKDRADKLSTREWMERREAQLAKSAKGR